MEVVTGAIAGIIGIGNFSALSHVDTFGFEGKRYTVLGDVHVDLVGPGAGGAVFERDAVGAIGITVGAGIAPMINIAAFGGQDFKHGSVCEIKCKSAIICWVARIMTDRPSQPFG